MTKQLKIRIGQHKRKAHPNTFSARYNLNKLIFYENYSTKEEALIRERRLKKWRREWKIRIIEEMNPNWKDLYSEL